MKMETEISDGVGLSPHRMWAGCLCIFGDAEMPCIWWRQDFPVSDVGRISLYLM